jgi:HPt (histidine-containing phosphotransfer) domain-containing protein
MRRDFKDYVASGKELVRDLDRHESAFSWALGDLALEFGTYYGEHSLPVFAKAIKLPAAAVRDCRRVAGAFQNVERSTNLSWSHHRIIAEQDDRLEWLLRSERNGWSVQRLRDQINRAETREREQVARRVAHRLASGAAKQADVSKVGEQIQTAQAQRANPEADQLRRWEESRAERALRFIGFAKRGLNRAQTETAAEAAATTLRDSAQALIAAMGSAWSADIEPQAIREIVQDDPNPSLIWANLRSFSAWLGAIKGEVMEGR